MFLFKDVLRSALLAIVFSIVSILILGVVVKLCALGDDIIKICNILVKAISVIVGTIIGIKDGRQGVLKGVLVGVVYVLETWGIFSLFVGEGASINLNLFNIILCVVAGVIASIIKVNKIDKKAV